MRSAIYGSGTKIVVIRHKFLEATITAPKTTVSVHVRRLFRRLGFGGLLVECLKRGDDCRKILKQLLVGFRAVQGVLFGPVSGFHCPTSLPSWVMKRSMSSFLGSSTA